MLVVVIQSGPRLSAATATRTHHTMKPCGYNAVISEDRHRLTRDASSALWKSVIFLKVFLKRCYLGFHPGVTQFREDTEEASVALLLAALYKRLVFASLHTRAWNVQHAMPLEFYHLLRLTALTLSSCVPCQDPLPPSSLPQRVLALHFLASSVYF